ncbi:hypothetical protein [Ensifer sp. MJa1]|uniref:hypothetical protein n=1 Tax=Ensifer sp. MJa1 TaxID=2919888 RepID=UPI00300B2CFC
MVGRRRYGVRQGEARTRLKAARRLPRPGGREGPERSGLPGLESVRSGRSYPLSTGFPMNMTSFRAPNAIATLIAPADRAGKILHAGDLLLRFLERGQAMGAADLRAILTDIFGGYDAEGFWAWKGAYEATVVAQHLFQRQFGAAISARANARQATQAALTKVASLIPTHTRRSQESEQLQQFSTLIPFADVAARAAGPKADDTVLEPSAGTGLLAIFAELAHAQGGLKSMGLFSEMIAWKVRLFIPASEEGSVILSRRHPIVDVTGQA